MVLSVKSLFYLLKLLEIYKFYRKMLFCEIRTFSRLVLF